MGNLPNYPSNNRSAPKEPPKPEPIAQAKVVEEKRSKATSFSNAIISISSKLWQEVIVVALKEVANDFVVRGTSMVLYPDDENRRGVVSRNRHSSAPVNYARYGRVPRTTVQRPYSDAPRPAFSPTAGDIELLVFPTRPDAEAVLGRLFELVAEYGYVKVGDYYQISGRSSTPIHEQYGWYNIATCQVRHHPEGFILDLPSTSYLN